MSGMIAPLCHPVRCSAKIAIAGLGYVGPAHVVTFEIAPQSQSVVGCRTPDMEHVMV